MGGREAGGRINKKTKEKKKDCVSVKQVPVPSPIFPSPFPTHATRRNFYFSADWFVTECPHHRNTHTYTGLESNQVKNVDLATEKS